MCPGGRRIKCRLKPNPVNATSNIMSLQLSDTGRVVVNRGGIVRRRRKCLATRGGHRVIVVLLNDLFRTPDAIALIDWAFAAHAWPPG